jgi:hypothetical protein
MSLSSSELTSKPTIVQADAPFGLDVELRQTVADLSWDTRT